MVNEGKIPLPDGCSLKIEYDDEDNREVNRAEIRSHRGDMLFRLESKMDFAASRILKRMCCEIEEARKGLQPITGTARDAKEGEPC